MPELPQTKNVLRPLAIAGLGFLMLHFLITIVYTVHGLPVEGSVKSAVQSYMVPMFHQGWQLFAPDVPGYQNTLHYKVFDEGFWSDPIDASELSIIKHRKVPYATQKMAKELAFELSKKLYYDGDEPMLDKVKGTAKYYRSVNFCAMHWKHENGSFPDSIQIILGYITTPDFHTRQKEVEDMEFTFQPDGL